MKIGHFSQPRTGANQQPGVAAPGKRWISKQEFRGNEFRRINEHIEGLSEKSSTSQNPLIKIDERPSDIIPNPSFMYRPMAWIQ
ncbi:hypothetical protein DYD21_07070 [Rhodohalobacter sp. SW132]|nr:hypothetical protein DYD21_07070 [Rhodohalobacter sp. SW132]